METSRLLRVCRGDEPADLLLTGARVVNVFSGEVVDADVAIAGRRIAGVGPGRRAHETLDLGGRFVAPGLVDAHVHIESAMVPPAEFARVVVPHGVTTVVADPHEIANVLGLEGVRFMLRDARRAPLRVELTASSSVPATDLATAGGELTAEDLATLRDEGAVLGLAEVMDYQGVVAGRRAVLDKIHAFAGRPVDGHCPGLVGPELDAYVAAGIQTDHECTTAAEAQAKIRAGMTVLIREGSLARDLATLLPLVEPATERAFCLCTDDRHVTDLIARGSIDEIVRAAIGQGLDPLTAIRIATLNPATHYGLGDRGGVAPGRLADLVVFDDLAAPVADEVFVGGRLVARRGRMLHEAVGSSPQLPVSVRVDWDAWDPAIPAEGRTVRAIGVVPGLLTTRELRLECRLAGGRAVADPERDLLPIVVVERHRASGRIGRGFVHGLGLRRGAIAGTVVHDHHNLICVGVDDASMTTAARAVAADGGGLAVAEGDGVLARLPLPIAGLMSDRPFAQVAEGLAAVARAARELGSDLSDPLMTLSFLGLEVIPQLKLTDRGLVDVAAQRHVPLFV